MLLSTKVLSFIGFFSVKFEIAQVNPELIVKFFHLTMLFAFSGDGSDNANFKLSQHFQQANQFGFTAEFECDLCHFN